MDPLSILVGLVVGAIAATAGLYLVGGHVLSPDERVLEQVRIDALTTGNGFVRRRPEDGKLERIDPKAIDLRVVG